MFIQLALHVSELCLIRYNILLIPIVIWFVHFNLTVLRKVCNIEAFFLAEWIFPSFTSLDHGSRRDDTPWI